MRVTVLLAAEMEVEEPTPAAAQKELDSFRESTLPALMHGIVLTRLKPAQLGKFDAAGFFAGPIDD